MSAAAPILVTGTIRSGSTWVGKVLAAHPRVGYINEPLNLQDTPVNRGKLPVDRPFWYMHIDEHNEAAFLPAYKNLVRFRFNIQAAAERLEHDKSNGSLYSKEEIRVIEEYARFATLHLNRVRPLVKDPFALVSVPWFVDRLDMIPVILIRHPAAFTSSVLKLGWGAGFNQFVQQPELLDKYPVDDSEIELYRKFESTGNKLGLAALGWKYQHRVILDYAREHPEWLFVRHEDLSREPMKLFQQICHRLKLEFHPRIQAKIKASTSSKNQGELPADQPHQVHLDSRKNITAWKRRLNEEQILEIRRIVEEVSSQFYDSEDW